MKMGGLLSGAVGPSSAADDPSASSGQALREKLIHNWNEKVKYPCSIIWRWFLLSYPNSECFVSQNTSMNSFPTQKSNKFGISIMTDRSFSEKRKIRNEYKTKKTIFSQIGSLIPSETGTVRDIYRLFRNELIRASKI